jgi:D-beta-D-heptose 7-phosphate kinase/D-beta-D-heptose 1-phosphate adenosyltransferase
MGTLSYSAKVKTYDSIKKIARALKKKKRTVVFTNGCFDLIHPGHLYYLEKCRTYGDALIVGLNSDASVKKIKGPGRPLFSQRERAFMLSQLSCVDYIVIFGETTPLRLITQVRPDYLVKGGDYRGKKLVGEDFLATYGGKVKLIPYLKGYSTTALITHIAKACRR